MKKYEKMYKRRRELGYTQKSLGQRLGLSKQYIWNIENGRKPLSYKLAYHISILLETTPDELFLKSDKEK